MPSELEKRVQLLEEKFEYQDQLVETLNQVITDQQDQIDKIHAEMKKLREDIGASNADFGDVNEPPPHY